MSQVRALLRPYRVELVAAAVLSVVMVVIAGGVILRMAAFGIPPACFGPSMAMSDVVVADCERLGPGALNAYYQTLSGLMGAGVGAVTVVPLLIAIVLGIALVAREIEQQTTVFAWSMATSRIRWHLRRVLPVAAIVVGVGLVAGLLGDLLAVARQPYLDPYLNFEGLGARGPAIAGAALLAFGVALHAGAILGRQLSSLLLGSLVIVPMLIGTSVVTDAWLRDEAEIAVVDAVDNGARSLDSMIRTPEGEFIGWEEAYSRYGSEVDGAGSTGSRLAIASRFVPATVYPVAVARIAAILGGIGLLGIALTAVIIDRRRPYQ